MDRRRLRPVPGRHQFPARLRPLPRTAGDGPAHHLVPDRRGQPGPGPCPRRPHLPPARIDPAPVRRAPVRRVPWRLRDLYLRLQPRIADRTDRGIRGGGRPVSAAAAASRAETQTRRGAEPMTPFTDPRVRLAAGTVALLVTAAAARRGRVGPGEAAAFRAVNNLPGWLYPPAWVVMQAGALGAAPAAAGAALLAGDRELAGRLLAGGTSAWALSKAVKHLVRRPRPAGLLAGTRRRGREPTGLGYLSGHAGVAVALGAAAFPRLGPGGRALTLAVVPVVGLTRIYVGAHLPLDVAGGAALGVVIDAAFSLVSGGPGQAAGRASPPVAQAAVLRRSSR